MPQAYITRYCGYHTVGISPVHRTDIIEKSISVEMLFLWWASVSVNLNRCSNAIFRQFYYKMTSESFAQDFIHCVDIYKIVLDNRILKDLKDRTI